MEEANGLEGGSQNKLGREKWAFFCSKSAPVEGGERHNGVGQNKEGGRGGQTRFMVMAGRLVRERGVNRKEGETASDDCMKNGFEVFNRHRGQSEGRKAKQGWKKDGHD